MKLFISHAPDLMDYMINKVKSMEGVVFKNFLSKNLFLVLYKIHIYNELDHIDNSRFM